MKIINFYEEHSGSFKGRQHLVNHIDMIMGLGENSHIEEIAGRDLLLLSPDMGDMTVTDISLLSEEELFHIRSHILRESLFATEWKQIALLHDNDYFSSNDIKNDEDVFAYFDACIDVWLGNSIDISTFAETTSAVILLRSWNPVIADRIVVRRRPKKDELENLPVAINSHRVIAARHSTDTSWKIFAERICKNSYVKKFLNDRQKNICPVCGKAIRSHVVVHHVDYDYYCKFCNSGNDWRVLGTRVQPDCERCHKLHCEWFLECMSRLRAVHNSCNYLIDCML